MKRLASTVAILTATFASLVLLFAIEPFDRINDLLDRTFGAPPSWTQVRDVYRNADIQEVTRGDHPLESFRVLARRWTQVTERTRIILMGNSQTQMISLAPGEPPPSGPEKTYTDLIADQLHDRGDRAWFYRLSAGALSYEEMLWYTAYLLQRPELKPGILLIQLNYQNFANAGVREGMLEMLSDGDFRKSIESLAGEKRPYSDSLAQALQRFRDSQSRGAGQEASQEGQAGGKASFGYVLETDFRKQLNRIPGFARGAAFKESFSFMLFRGRAYFLRVQQSTRRSVGGPRLEASRAALDRLIAVATMSGVRVMLFQAPTNPAVPLYRTTEDDRSYHEFASYLAHRYGLPVFDFEHSVPGRNWGMTLNAPDPLHLSRTGHRMLANLMVQQLDQNGI